MTTNRISTRQEAVEHLKTGCDRCLGYLRELNTIHLAIDDPKRKAAESEAECVLRLRKVYFHIQAVTSWSLSLDVMHMMGPDIRAATKQLEPIVSPELDGCHNLAGLATQRGYVEEREKQLAFLSHPTPAILIHSRVLGGFGKTDAILYLLKLDGLLMGLTFEYGLGLGVVAEVLNRSKQSEIIGVINRAKEELPSISPKEVLRFVEACK